MSGDNDPFLDAIQATFGGHAIGYVIVANVLDGEGETRICTDTFENQRCDQTLGLLAFCDAVERRRAADAYFEDDE